MSFSEVFATVLGIAGSVLGALIAVPQAARALRVGVAGVSSATFQLLFALGLTWMLYGFAEDLWLLALSDGVLAASTLMVLAVLQRSGVSVWENTRIALMMTAIMVAVTLVDATWLGWLAGLLSVVLRYPQMRLVRGSSSVDGVSLSTWNIAAATNACWCVYGILHHDPRLAIATGVNLAITAVLIRAVQSRRPAIRPV